jgi:hypothetical protein
MPTRSPPWCESRVPLDDAGQHPSHRLPSLLRAALYRRHRPDRRARARQRRRRYGRGLSLHRRRRLRRDAAIGRELWIATSRPMTRRARRAPAASAYLRTAPRSRRDLPPSRCGTMYRGAQAIVEIQLRRRHEPDVCRPFRSDPGNGAVLARAAHLAQRLLRRAARESPVPPTLSSEQGAALMRGAADSMPTTATRRGTTRPCRSPSACALADGRPMRRA